MSGERQSAEPPWKRVFSQARSVLANESADPGNHLLTVLDEALRAVAEYFDVLFTHGKKPLPVLAFQEWQEYFKQLYETADLYMVHPGLLAEPNLIVRLEAIKNFARGTVLQLQDMQESNPPLRKDREDVLDEMEKLKNLLQQSVNELRALLRVRATPIDVITYESVLVPLVGRIAAGVPIMVDENIEALFPLPGNIVRDVGYFMLKVSGDSMIGAGIKDGDLVVVKQRRVAGNDDIVAAMTDDGVTIKKFWRQDDGHILLLPENPAHQAIDGDQAEILGTVVAVLRQLD